MIRALGFSENPFDPSRPGRLCRGRERWIEPFEIEAEGPWVQRLVVSGAAFTDDSAADAQRGLSFAGMKLSEVVQAVLPDRPLLAFTEDGHPADIPDEATDVELYSGHRAGGRSEELMVRWFREVSDVQTLSDLLDPDDADAYVRGLITFDDDVEMDDDLRQALFLTTGMGTLDSPPSRFQPAALPDLLDLVDVVVMLHRDKHGPAVGFYSASPLGAGPRLEALAQSKDVLPIPFAIPPMLARWDRALAEARVEWTATHDDPFPVPVAPEPSGWEPRRNRRNRKSRRDRLAAQAAREAAAARGEE